MIDAALLPCPLSAGWELLWQEELPKLSAKGEPIGGFSALQLLTKFENKFEAKIKSKLPQLLLLSDAQRSFTLAAEWRGSLLNPRWKLGEPEPIQGLPSTPFDGEAIVESAGYWWMATEARNRETQPAELLQLDKTSAFSFGLIQRFPLPDQWQPAADSGLLPNQGPEALLALPGQQLLLAAERPLRQDPSSELRLLLAQIISTPAKKIKVEFRPIGTPLSFQPAAGAEAHWGLTDLIALKNGALLALWRGYQEPQKWWARLELFPFVPLTETKQAALKPIAHWDLIGFGLMPDNWEAMGEGPRLGDGRSTLLLASDDNFNPLQANRVALLAPLRLATCGKGRP
jgi:hypothetical protein